MDTGEHFRVLWGNVHVIMDREHGTERDRKQRVQRSTEDNMYDHSVTTGSDFIRRFVPEMCFFFLSVFGLGLGQEPKTRS